MPTGLRCGHCLAAPPPFERSIAALGYGYPWDRLITRFKFHDGLDLAPALAARLVEAVDATGASAGVDLVLPVPLSPARLRTRGYNQAWELARRCARTLGLPADAESLVRLRESAPQSSLPLAERRAAVRGSFAVGTQRQARITGRRVALVDDVMTSGATVAEAAAGLLHAGAAAVQVWVLARTPRP